MHVLTMCQYSAGREEIINNTTMVLAFRKLTFQWQGGGEEGKRDNIDSGQWSANFICKEAESKYFRLRGSYSLLELLVSAAGVQKQPETPSEQMNGAMDTEILFCKMFTYHEIVVF